MKEKIKSIMSKWYSLVLLVLAVALTIFSFTPIIQINTDEFGYSKMFEEGRYTSKMKYNPEVNLGINTFFDIISDAEDFVFVVKVQNMEDDIKRLEKKLKEYEDDEIKTETQIDLETELEEIKIKHEKLLSDFGDQGEERVLNKLDEDEKFRDAIGVLYAFMGCVENGFNSPEGVPSGYEVDGLSIMRLAFMFSLVPTMIIVIVVFIFVLIIKSIIKIVQYIKGMKNKKYEELNEKMEKFPFVGYSITMTVFVALLAFLAPRGVSLGVAIIASLVILGIFTLIQLAKELLAEEKELVNIIVKRAISLVSVIVGAIFICNFIGVGLLNELEDVIVEISNKQFVVELEKLLETGQEYKTCEKAAYAIVADSNAIKIAIFFVVSAFGTILGLVALIRSIARLRNKEIKFGKLKTKLKAMPVIAILVLIVSIAPTYISADTKEEIDTAYEAGQLKVWYDEYKEEGSSANIDYELLKGFQEKSIEDIDDLKAKVKNASEEEKEQLLEKIEKAETDLLKIRRTIKAIEVRAVRPTTCIVASVILVISEFAYLIVPKILNKKENIKEDADETLVTE